VGIGVCSAKGISAENIKTIFNSVGVSVLSVHFWGFCGRKCGSGKTLFVKTTKAYKTVQMKLLINYRKSCS